MAFFNEKTSTVTEYPRARLIQITNELDTNPTLIICEELVSIKDSVVTHSDMGQIKIDFDQNGIVPLYDPATDLPTGEEMTHAELQMRLYSVYRYETIKRAEALAQAEQPL